MKKVLLSTAAAAGLLSVASAEIGSGFFVGLKGGMNIFNLGGKASGAKASSDKSTDAANADIDLAGFGLKGWNVGVEGGYSYRTQGGFTIGASLFAGYNNNVVSGLASLDGKKLDDVKKDDVLSTNSIDLSGFDAQLRVRIGYAFSKFHIFINPGFATTFATPKSADVSIDTSKETFAKKDGTSTDLSDATFMSKSAFISALNFNHAITPTMYYGISVGGRMNFAKGENLYKTPTDAQKKFEAPIGLEIGLTFGANF
jgi:hypothetical protein